jgi:ligand-binding sensor domain-containing protein
MAKTHTIRLTLLALLFPLLSFSQERLWKSYSTSDGLPSRYINTIFQDRDGAMWFGTDKGVARFDGVTFTTFDREGGLPEDFIIHIAQDSNGTMFFKTFEKGWAKLQANTVQPVSEHETKWLSSLQIESSHRFYHKQLNRLVTPNANSEELFLCTDGEEPFAVNYTFEDKEGSLWVGTFGQGVKKMRSSRVTRYSKASGLPSNETNTVFKDSRGRVWIGTTQGAAFIHEAQVATLPAPINDPEKINTVGFAEQGDTLIVAGLHYLFRLHMDLTNQHRLYKQTSQRITDGISAIRYSDKGFTSEKRHALWIATYGSGVYCVEEQSRKTLRLDNGLASNMIETIDEGVASIWFSSRNAGVSKLQNGIIQTVTTNEGLPSNIVFSVFEEVSKNGDTTAWICTSKGLVRWNRCEKKIFTTKDGLSSDMIRYAFRQRNGQLWAVTRIGLCRLENEGQPNEHFTAIGSIPIRPKKESAISNFYFDDEQENLWVATSDGVLKIDVKNFSPLMRSPLTRISKVKLDTLELFSPTAIEEQPYWRNTVTFFFTSDSYQETEQYRFRLKGSDKTWSLTSEKSVTYRNLPDGQYEMEVYAINADGVESKNPARFAFTIAPPFWKSKWAYAIYVLLLTALVWTVRWIVQNWNIIVENRKRRYIGRYELKTLLGEGGMGKVYQAIDIKTKRVFAIKLLHSALLNDRENRRRLANEGQLLREFSHPNIIKVYEVGESNEQVYLVMEYLSGKTLKEYLNAHHPLPLETIQQLALQICDGLSEIHRHSVVHRDLKTSNLMLDEKGTVRIMDFGLSKSPLVSMKTTLGTIIGTLGYVAPEQITGTMSDARTDIFSFGVVLYELCTNQLPFAGENEMAVIHAIFNRTPTPISELRPDLPKALAQIVSKCLQNDLNLRYQTVEEIKQDLESLGRAEEVAQSLSM